VGAIGYPPKIEIDAGITNVEIGELEIGQPVRENGLDVEATRGGIGN